MSTETPTADFSSTSEHVEGCCLHVETGAPHCAMRDSAIDAFDARGAINGSTETCFA